jgi:hypothetical protein
VAISLQHKRCAAVKHQADLEGHLSRMTQLGTERRRLPRVHVSGEGGLSLSVSIPVQVVDISKTGVMLASKCEMSVGDRAELLATVGPRSLRVVIEVRHVSIDTQPRRGIRYRAGAVFAPMSAEQRLLLEQLLGPEPN